MATIINQRPFMSTDTLPNYRRLELAQKVEGQIAKIIQFLILESEEGFLTISEDKSLRVLLKRESGQFWPSVIEYLPNVPTCLSMNEEAKVIFVGLVTGVVYQYSISDDWNSLELVRRLSAHTNSTTSVVYAPLSKEVYSCGRDKTLVWHSAETGSKNGQYHVGAPCSVLQFDGSSNFAFVGDLSGSVFVLRINGPTAQLVSKLTAISALAWNPKRQLLFSASTDSLVIIWDIGGKKGECYELNGHDSKIMSLALVENDEKLLSVDDTGHLVCWDLRAKRIVAPAWKDKDNCELCDVPFIWNLKVMWDRKCVGVRRHHCRTCGISVCGNCCNNWTIFPAMGFEKPTRICRTCKRKMDEHPNQFDLTPLATITELRQGVVDMKVQLTQNRLATVGYDRTILVWNVSPLL